MHQLWARFNQTLRSYLGQLWAVAKVDGRKFAARASQRSEGSIQHVWAAAKVDIGKLASLLIRQRDDSVRCDFQAPRKVYVHNSGAFRSQRMHRTIRHVVATLDTDAPKSGHGCQHQEEPLPAMTS